MDEETKTVTFAKPISLGKGDGAVSYEKAELREPTAGELEKAGRADTQTGVAISLVALVSGMPRPAVERMPQRELQECIDFLEVFSKPSPAKTSGTQ